MKKHKKIAIIGAVGVPAAYGGFETMVDNLLPFLTVENDVTVYCSGKTYTKKERMGFYKGAKLKYINLNANGLSSLLYDSVSILKAAKNSDVILCLGVSGGFVFPLVTAFSKAKIVVNVDGLEWRRQKWGRLAKALLKMLEWTCIKFSHADIADNQGIKRYLSYNYNVIGQLIAYGGDHSKSFKPNQSLRKKYPFVTSDYDFKVARIEPENNIRMILNAYSNQLKRRLVVVGNWFNSPFGRELYDEYLEYDNLILLAPIYDAYELGVLRGNCSLYIHGHSAGGTNPSLVEAMFLGLPVLSYDVSFNRFTTKDKAIFYKNEQHLLRLLNNLDEARLCELANDMKSIAAEEYRWKLIAEKYLLLFKALDYKYEKSWVNPFVTDKVKESIEVGEYHLNLRKDVTWN
jgi:glycosyltransferase involved in cell wall biosynthesis